jgi:signal transduction histidine kinase
VNVSLASVALDEGTAPIVCGVVTDLGLIRKRADELASANADLASEIEERIRAQGSLQLALDSAKMGSWDLDLRRGTSTRSLRLDNLFGYTSSQEHWSLETLIAHVLPEDREAVAGAFQDSRRTGRVDCEARIRRADNGAFLWLRFTGQTFYEDDVAVRIAGVVSDVTDRRAIEERLRQAQKLEAVGQLTGGIAHDFNNLLMVISGGLEMFDRQSDRSRRERILSGMRQAVARGSSLSSQLLAFSRKQPLRAEPISVSQQVAGMQELLDRSLRGDVQVVTDFPDGLWPIEVDPGEFELVLLNLAVNARDALPNGGVITISAANVANVTIGDRVGEFVRLAIADNGLGISPGDIARVFEPFFTTKEVGRGSGLGLAQTHGFARSSGGRPGSAAYSGRARKYPCFCHGQGRRRLRRERRLPLRLNPNVGLRSPQEKSSSSRTTRRWRRSQKTCSNILAIA